MALPQHRPDPESPDRLLERPLTVVVADEPEAPRPQTAPVLAPPRRIPPGLVGSALLPPAGRSVPGAWTRIRLEHPTFSSPGSALLFAAVYVLLLLVLMAALALRA